MTGTEHAQFSNLLPIWHFVDVVTPQPESNFLFFYPYRWGDRKKDGTH